MKFSVSNICWPTGDDPAFFEILIQGGFVAVDIAPTKIWKNWQFSDKDIDHFNALLSSYNLQALGMQSIFFGLNDLNVFSRDLNKWEETLEHMKKVAKLASKLGISQVEFGAPKNRDPLDMNLKEMHRLSIERFSEIADIYENNCVTLCMEPVPDNIGGKFLTSTREVIDFVRKINNKFMKLNLDTAVLIHEKNKPQKIIYDNADLIGHIHISEPNLGSFNTPSKMHNQIASSLKEINYEKVIAIEMLGEKDKEVSNLKVAINFVNNVYRK
jgi:D-psicose/D-tagatose/L-ribulose 3-epimerase